MRKKNFSKEERDILEGEGQMTIFEMLEAGIDPDEIIERAENDIETAKMSELKAAVKNSESPIGLKTDGMNMDIEEMINKPNLSQDLAEALSAAIDDNESLSSHENELDIDQESLSVIINKGFEAKDDKIENDSDELDYEFFTLDDFAGSEPGYDDRLIAFDTSLSVDDSRFVVAAPKEQFSSIAEFKAEFSGQGGLNEHLIIAFPLKADCEPERVISMYEKKVAQSHKVDIKNADKEAKEIAEIVNSGMESDDYLDDNSEVDEKPVKKRGRKPRV